jgi:hypothetical protein
MTQKAHDTIPNGIRNTAHDIPSETDDDAADFPPATKLKKKKPAQNRGAFVAVLALLIALGFGAYQYRRAEHLEDSVAHSDATIAQLQQQIITQTQELQAATIKLQDVARRSLPVSVIFRPSPSGTGLTTFFRNNAPATISIGLVLTNPATERRREVNLTLSPNGLQSIGEPEGWVFAPGHRIQISHAELGSVEYVVPEKP